MNTVINLIRHQASVTPDNIAVVYSHVSCTYREVLAENGLTVGDGYVEVENVKVPILYTDELQAVEATTPFSSWREVGGDARDQGDQ